MNTCVWLLSLVLFVSSFAQPALAFKQPKIPHPPRSRLNASTIDIVDIVEQPANDDETPQPITISQAKPDPDPHPQAPAQQTRTQHAPVEKISPNACESLESFKASLGRDPTSENTYIVDGDVPIHGNEQVQRLRVQIFDLRSCVCPAFGGVGVAEPLGLLLG
jgi:hypothetical protein